MDADEAVCAELTTGLADWRGPAVSGQGKQITKCWASRPGVGFEL
jgi:hypothetical protein